MINKNIPKAFEVGDMVELTFEKDKGKFMVIGKDGGMILVSPEIYPGVNFAAPVRLRHTEKEK